MMKKAVLSMSVVAGILLSGCDNTAKVPEAEKKTETAAVTQAMTIGYSDWPASWLGKLPLKKAG